MLARAHALPLRLVPFLDHAADLSHHDALGGGSIFIHRMLLDYFATLHANKQA